MVTVLIVAILAAVAIPRFRGRVDAAKWSEGKGVMGSVATAIRVYIAMNERNFKAVPTLSELGIEPRVLDGTYFKGGNSGTGDFSWVINSAAPLDFLITATAPEGITTPSEVTLNASGQWTVTP
jgi:type II secretory pathway pseudopilin PulG